MKLKLWTSVIIIGLTFVFYISFSMRSQHKVHDIGNVQGNPILQNGQIEQSIIGVLEAPVEITSIYYDNVKLGVIQDEEAITKMLDDVYDEKYQAIYPNGSIALSSNIVITKEKSYNLYDNKDTQILNFIKENALFDFEAYKIVFSNGNTVYFNDLEMFNAAKKEYLLTFIDEKEYEQLQKNTNDEYIPEGVYKSVFTSIRIVQNQEEPVKTHAPLEKILQTKEEMIKYFSYGYSGQQEFHQVKAGETVQGIAFQTGLLPKQIVTLNHSILDVNHILEVGSFVNISYFTSPITVITEKNRRYKETTYRGEVEWIIDESLPMGEEEVVSSGYDGYKDVLVHEKYEDGILVETEVLSSVDIVYPKNPVKKRGSKIVAGIGTGIYRYPVDNWEISCSVFNCYSGHTGTDFIDTYNRYGPIFAADGGTIVVNSYHYINGYWVEIDHGNGMRTYYGHMIRQSPLPIGTKVSKGEYIGDIGQTGLAFGAHVHFEIRAFYSEDKYNVVTCDFIEC